jgi:hypothetical protein
MGTVRVPPSVQFFASIICGDSAILSVVETELVKAMGPIDERTDMLPFLHSDYYCREMGDRLTRYLLLFQPLADRGALAATKEATNEIERVYAREGHRSVNIDPGYMALEQVVLATTKGFAHRIYLGRGIFADLTLVYENGTYRGLQWTYPDYANELVPLLNRWREHYKGLLRCQKV